MKTFKRTRTRIGRKDGRRGSVLVFIVAGIVMLLAMVLISVDVASMQLVQTELRAATDAAAKAGSEALLRTQNRTLAVQAACDMAEFNYVAGKPFKIAPADIVIGTCVEQADGSWAFGAAGSRPNAVRVNSRMTPESASGSVTLAFGRVFNMGIFTPTRSSTAAAIPQEICLCIDRSASMSWDHSGVDWVYPSGGARDLPPVPGSRWSSLSKALSLYLDEVAATPVPTRVGLVTWASDLSGESLPPVSPTAPPYVAALIESPLSYDFAPLNDAVGRRSAFPIYGSTNMSAGIDKAVEALNAADVRPFAQRSVILMSDGQWNQGRNPIEAAQAARDQGIIIHVVTFLPDGQTADAQAVASTTGGIYIHAEDEAELMIAFEKLARTLPVVLTE